MTATFVIAQRTVRKFMRTPQLVIVGTIQGAMFLLIFRYVFGGAINGTGLSYVDFLVPGFVVTTVLFIGSGASAGVAEDVEHGFTDRLRSLPIPRLAAVAGRALADTTTLVWGLAITTGIGFAVGFRFTLSITRDGIGTFCNSAFNPSCFSTASKAEIPSAPLAARAPRAVHSSSKSQEPSSFVESITS